MAKLNIDVTRIEQASADLQTQISDLNGKYSYKLNTELEDISKNIENEGIRSILNTIRTRVDGILYVFNRDMPKLQEFLASQMRSYKKTEEDAVNDFTTALNNMRKYVNPYFTPITSAMITATAVVATEAPANATTATSSTKKSSSTSSKKKTSTKKETSKVETKEEVKEEVKEEPKQEETPKPVSKPETPAQKENRLRSERYQTARDIEDQKRILEDQRRHGSSAESMAVTQQRIRALEGRLLSLDRQLGVF